MGAISMDVEGSSEMDYQSDSRSIACSDCEHKEYKIDCLQKTTEECSIQSLSQVLDEKSLASRFCCGGMVELGEDETVTIAYGYSSKGEPYQIDFPLDNDLKKAKLTNIFNRLHTTSGANGTIDAAPLGSVTTSFDPNRAGLVDMISQLIVPGIVKGKRGAKDPQEHIGLKATLSKLYLNSPKTSKPILPPPVSTHFGTLVVCLPHKHTGGRWKISIDGHAERWFDWRKASPHIGWLAMRGDCDWEPHNPIESYQIVLIYDLTLKDSPGAASKTLDPESIPLYQQVRKTLEHSSFMKKGGILGFYCQLPYHHTRKNAAKLLPKAFKGIDLAMYAVFKSMGLKVVIKPLLDTSPLNKFDEKLFQEETAKKMADRQYRSWMEDEHYFGSFLCSQCDGEWPMWKQWKEHTQEATSRIGKAFHPLIQNTKKSKDHRTHSDYFRQVLEEDLEETWPHTKYENVVWLNKPQDKEKGCSEMAILNVLMGVGAEEESLFGMGESLEIWESHLVILVEIPKASERELPEIEAKTW